MSEREGSSQTLNVLQISQEYNIGRNRVYEDIASGRLVAVRLGRRLLVRRERVEEWLRSLEGVATE